MWYRWYSQPSSSRMTTPQPAVGWSSELVDRRRRAWRAAAAAGHRSRRCPCGPGAAVATGPEVVDVRHRPGDGERDRPGLAGVDEPAGMTTRPLGASTGGATGPTRCRLRHGGGAARRVAWASRRRSRAGRSDRSSSSSPPGSTGRGRGVRIDGRRRARSVARVVVVASVGARVVVVGSLPGVEPPSSSTPPGRWSAASTGRWDGCHRRRRGRGRRGRRRRRGRRQGDRFDGGRRCRREALAAGGGVGDVQSTAVRDRRLPTPRPRSAPDRGRRRSSRPASRRRPRAGRQVDRRRQHAGGHRREPNVRRARVADVAPGTK